MRCLEHQMLAGIDQRSLAPGVVPPEHEYHSVAVVGDVFYDGVGEFFPSYPFVRCGLSGAHREDRVQQQHALPGPGLEVVGPAHPDAQVALYFLIDVHERGGSGHAVGHREAQAHRLAWIMIRVLTQDNHFDILHRSELEGPENAVSRGIDGLSLLLFGMEIRDKPRKVRLVELTLQGLSPGFFYLYVHFSKMKSMTSFISLTYTKSRPFT